MERILNKKNEASVSSGEACSVKTVHEDVVESVRQNMPSQVSRFELADFFKLFSDSTRISILCALSESEMCVCDLCALLNMKQSAISHQLRTLKQVRIVRNRREGKSVYYALDDDHIREVMKVGMAHVTEPQKLKGEPA
ncbi:MAG: helix-turn-helix transcriptional regulator [Deltaproteobacteria bacterium]|nr:helix-turn-helix transcriptional regulator [Deltaproteobacteria bacterium]